MLFFSAAAQGVVNIASGDGAATVCELQVCFVV